MGSPPHIHGALKGCILVATDRIMKLIKRGSDTWVVGALTQANLQSYI